MNKTLSDSAFQALAQLYDCGQQRINGIDLINDFGHCIKELLSCGALHPDAPLRSLSIEENGCEVVKELFRSPGGRMVYLTEDGLFTPTDESRRQYRFEPCWLMHTLNQELLLKGTIRQVTDAAFFLGVLVVGRQEHEIYWSRRPTTENIAMLDHALQQRPLPLPTTILSLHKPIQQPGFNTPAQHLSLQALWHPNGKRDRAYFQRCVTANFLPSISHQGNFSWLVDASTFVFRDQTIFTFSRGHATTIVNLLVEQWHTGRPWIDEQHLLRDLLTGCHSGHIKDVLKRTCGWQHVVWITSSRCRLRIPLPHESEHDCPPWTKNNKANNAALKIPL